MSLPDYNSHSNALYNLMNCQLLLPILTEMHYKYSILLITHNNCQCNAVYILTTGQMSR